VPFQFRDVRAKAATDIGDLAHSQKLLGHRYRDMTEHHVRQRRGERVRPLRRRASLTRTLQKLEHDVISLRFPVVPLKF
jgi:DNA-binding HxlR family transcriptional regulator